MDTEWKRLYARKNEHFIFEEEKVRQALEGVLAIINNHLTRVNAPGIKFKESSIEFPDCTVRYEVDKKQLTFVKENSKDGSTRQAELVINSKNLIVFTQTEHTYFSFDQEVLDDVFQVLLMS